jgi:hypothetical protein
MAKLHAATSLNGALALELLPCTYVLSFPGSFAHLGKSAPFGTILETLKGAFHPGTTRLERECIQQHIVGASLNSDSANLAFYQGE